MHFGRMGRLLENTAQIDKYSYTLRFDMDAFVGFLAKGSETTKTALIKEMDPSNKILVCPFGFSAFDPIFQADGYALGATFHLPSNEMDTKIITSLPELHDYVVALQDEEERADKFLDMAPFYNGEYAHQAVAEFFKLTSGQTTFIVNPTSYRSQYGTINPSHAVVMDRLTRVINDGWKAAGYEGS